MERFPLGRRTSCCLLLILLVFGSASPAPAVIIYESATLGTTGVAFGTSISSTQFFGARFSVDQTVTVTDIGGHILATGDLFGAIVSLSGPTAFPTGSPFDIGEVLGVTVFTPGFPSSDFRTPLSVALTPGDYALVFGSGLFGATGGGSMPTNNVPIPGGSRFVWNGPAWSESGIGGFTHRFVVEGVIPEASSAILFAIGTLVVGIATKIRLWT
jgi:hypothetical protein